MNKSAVLLAASLGLAMPAAFAAEGNPQIGARKVSMCSGCHGIPGYKITFPETYSVPKLGGQHAAYIVASLRAYRAGERDNATMRSIAVSLSEKDMADIAAYYARAK